MTNKNTFLVGAHTSAAGGVQNALYEGRDIGANTIQLFTSNQRQWSARPLSQETLDAWKKALSETNISNIMSHDSYLINLGSSNPEFLEKSLLAFRLELERCHALDITYLNFHPGAYVGCTQEECLDRIVESLLEMEALIHKGHTRLLLEATAGQGTAIGHRFEELAYIVEKVEKKIPIGVCIDTCHIFAAGYDIRTPENWDTTLKTFDQVVGLKHLYAWHVNDSMKGLGSRVDRHQMLGKGLIGWEAFNFLATDPRTRHLPMYLETPGGPAGWKEEIAKLKEANLCV